MKRRFTFPSVLVMIAMVLAPVTAFAAPPAQPAQTGEGYFWEVVGTWDASCEALFGQIGIYLGFDGAPAVDVPVTFTWNGSDFGPYYTGEDGKIDTIWAYTPGQGEVTVGISAEGYGYMEATFSGPEECEGAPVPSVEVSWACGQEAPAVTFGWTGDFDGMYAYISAEGDERWDETEANSLTFSELIPGATYYYYYNWWIEDVGWGFTEGYFTVPEECTAPPAPPAAPEETWVPRYRMLALIDYGAVPQYWGQGARNGSCWVKMPTAVGPPWVGRVTEVCAHPDLPADFVYTYDDTLYDNWVEWNPVTGEWRYPDPLWDPSWADPDYQTH